MKLFPLAPETQLKRARFFLDSTFFFCLASTNGNVLFGSQTKLLKTGSDRGKNKRLFLALASPVISRIACRVNSARRRSRCFGRRHGVFVNNSPAVTSSHAWCHRARDVITRAAGAKFVFVSDFVFYEIYMFFFCTSRLLNARGNSQPRPSFIVVTKMCLLIV